MKKLVSLFLIIFILFSTFVVYGAVSEESYLCTVFESDISDTNYQIYFMGCRGHYQDNAVTLYITNTSKEAINFQVIVGYSGSKENPTSVESGYVKLEPGVTGKFVVDNLSSFPEKANTDLGYVPNSQLGYNSVVRVQASNINVGDTFLVCGIDRYKSARDTSYKEIEAAAIISKPTNYAYINDAKLVIKKEVEQGKEIKEYTLEQPDSETVDKFLIFVVSSAIVCVGGIIIYTFAFITKRRENDD